MSQLDTINIAEDLFAEVFHKSGLNANTEKAQLFEAFTAVGLPSQKHEEYKFTQITATLKRHLKSANVLQTETPELEAVKDLFEKTEGHHIVYVNGSFAPSLSLIKVDEITKVQSQEDTFLLNKHTTENEAFSLLNAAFSTQFACITVAENKESLPVMVYHLIDGNQSAIVNPRLLIKAEKGSSLKLNEKFYIDGEENLFINNVTEVEVGKNAAVNITKVQNHGSNIVVVDTMAVSQKRDSKFNANTFSFAGKMIRNNLNISLDEENCETHMHGLYLIDGATHVDNHTSVDHKIPNCFSNEVYKGILDGKSHAVFNGKIFVRPNAQQTNAFQSNKNVSLSDDATINTKPQLEIWADDVKCSHGCTIGELDKEALFYLRARGLDEKAAKSLIL
ncbi:MAG: Fe-S cluster assembly protein SufD, partial [Cyclobacteriaceae bacterium]